MPSACFKMFVLYRSIDREQADGCQRVVGCVMGVCGGRTSYSLLELPLPKDSAPRQADSLCLIILAGTLRERLPSPNPRCCSVTWSWMAPTPTFPSPLTSYCPQAPVPQGTMKSHPPGSGLILILSSPSSLIHIPLTHLMTGLQEPIQVVSVLKSINQSRNIAETWLVRWNPQKRLDRRLCLKVNNVLGDWSLAYWQQLSLLKKYVNDAK